MSERDSTARRSPRGPLRRAFREARPILLAAIAMACAYNIFGANAIPWLREVHTSDSTSVMHLDADTSKGTASTTSVPPTDSNHVPATVDTAHSALTADSIAHARQVADSIANAAKDSARKAIALASKAQRDSTDKANAAALLAKLATAKEIDGDVAKKLYDMKAATFIDARPDDHFAEGHIPGAMNVYAEQWQTKLNQIVNLSRDRPIVTYCGGGDACELSHELADHLRELNFKVVVVYMGGIKEWTARKYPVATGSK